MALRDFLEEMVVTEASRHRTEGDVADLRAHLALVERASEDTDQLVDRIWALHLRIAQMTPQHHAAHDL